MSLEHARNNLNQMIDRILAKNPACEIIPMVMNPVFGNGRGRRPNLPSFDDNYREVAKELGFQLIDHGPAWNELLKKDPGHFLFCMPDTVHPLRAGGLTVSTAVMTEALGLKPGNPAKSKDQPCFDYLCRMMDKNKDRQVNMAEFDTYWQTRFDDSDTDQNGNLSQKELHADPLFKYLDKDENGNISFAEFLKDIKTHFTELDHNQDGILNKREIWN
jgi:hypothetical protein